MAQSFNFTAPNDYDIQARQIERRRKMAEQLQQQAGTPIDPGRMAGGYVIPISPFEGMAKLAQSWAAGKMQDRADNELRRMNTDMESDTMSRIDQAMRLSQGTPQIPAPSEELGGGPGKPAMPGDRKAAYAVLAGAQNPGVRQMALAQMLKAMEPAAPIKMGKDDRLVSPTNYETIVAPTQQPKIQRVEIPDGKGGQRVGFVDMNNPDPMSTFREGGVQPAKAEVLPSGQAINPYAVQPGTMFNDPNKIMGVGPDGQPVVNQPLVNAKSSIARAGAANVSVNTEKNLFGDIAGQVGKDIGAGPTQARAAVQTLNTVNQILEAMDSGKMIAGPGTTARQFMGQVGQVLGVSGKDATEQLVQTRKAIQGLAQLELDAAQQMKGQGQITEAERSIIRRAASGDIDTMTVPELRMLMTTMDKTSRGKIAANQRNVDIIRQNPGSAPLAPFMDVPMPPAYRPPANVPPPPPGFEVQR